MSAPVVPRPASVTLATTLVYLYGLLALATGVVIVWNRNNELADLPVTLARVNESLPFGGAQDDWVYVAAVGVLVGVVGVLIMVLAALLSRGSRVAHLLLLLIALALTAVGVDALRNWTGQFALWGADGLVAASAFMALVMLLLLVLRKPRRFLWGSRR